MVSALHYKGLQYIKDVAILDGDISPGYHQSTVQVHIQLRINQDAWRTRHKHWLATHRC